MDTSKEIGRFKISEDTDIVVREGMYKDQDYIDVRQYVKATEEGGYTGWTKKGIMLKPEQIGSLMKILKTVETVVDEEGVPF